MPQTQNSDLITLDASCTGCGKKMLITIPLHAVELEWVVTCPDCVAKRMSHGAHI